MVDGRGAWGCAVDAHVCRGAEGGAVYRDAGCALALIIAIYVDIVPTKTQSARNGHREANSDREARLKRGRWLYLLGFISTSQLAHAHGEDVLSSIYAELASIALCAGLLFLWRRAKPYRLIGSVACIIGLVVENWAVSVIPYMKHRNLISAAGFIVPAVATMLAVYVAQRRGRAKK